jgi:GAF domain-containing protein
VILSEILAITSVVINSIGLLIVLQGTSTLSRWTFGVPVILALVAYIFLRTKYFPLGNFLLISGLFSALYLNIFAFRLDLRDGWFLLIPIIFTLGSVILPSVPILFFIVLNIGAILFLPTIGLTLPGSWGLLIGLLVTYGLVLIFINGFRNSTENQRTVDALNSNLVLSDSRSGVQQNLEDRTIALDRRSSRLEAAAFVTRAAAEIRDMRELLDNVARQIANKFGFDHVGIFLADENNYKLNLVAASSEGGQNMLARGHKLIIGREGIVGFSAFQKRPRIAQNVGSDSIFSKNLDLPNTRSEAAIPLMAQNILIGVLDIQSEEENAFSPEDLTTLQSMADQIALAIENIRLVEQSRTVIQRLESINIDTTTRGWKDRLGGQSIGFVYTPLGVKPLAEPSPNDTEHSDEDQTIRIPITLRGKEIGKISLSRKTKESSWSETEKEMVANISAQVALALDNARLLEESQSRAVREKTVSEFSNRLSRSLDIDTLLQNAVREIYRLPQVSQVSLLINPSEDKQKTE